MTTKPGQKPEPGEVFHFLVTGLTHPTFRHGAMLHVVSRRGDQVTITDRLLEAIADRNGESWLDLLHDPAEQVAKFGRKVIAPGPTPEDMVTTVVGSPEHETASRKARADAWKIEDPQKRRAALHDVDKRFGPPPLTSLTLTTYGSGQ